MTKYDPRKNAEGYNDPTPYAAEKHMMAQIRGKQARVAGGYRKQHHRALQSIPQNPLRKARQPDRHALPHGGHRAHRRPL